MRIELFISWFFSITTLTILCSITIPVHSQCLEDQKSLLLQLKNSLQFEPYYSVKLVSWNQSHDCCLWNGVTCDHSGRVIGLDLSEESISGGLNHSSSLFSLKFLEKLNLAYNSFNFTQIPSSFGALTNLKYLNLSNSEFVGHIPPEFSRLTRLVKLDLSTSYSPETPSIQIQNPNLFTLFRNLSGITELYLDGVNISANGYEWGQAISSALPNLRVLSLRGCFLSGPIDSSLQNLQFLSEINLDWNDLSVPVPDFFANFANLTTLSLSYCNLNGTFPDIIFERVQTLETLNLSSNEFLNGHLPDFPQNLSLRNLVLSYTNFSGFLPESIGKMTELRRIEIHWCNFNGRIPNSLANLSQLVYLDLSYNNFSGPIPSFQGLKKLTHIDLSRNALTVHSQCREDQKYLLLQLKNSLQFEPDYSVKLVSWTQSHDCCLWNGVTCDHSGRVIGLDLNAESISGGLNHSSSLFSLKFLEKLNLAYNNFNSTQIPSSFGALTSLTYLNLSNCYFVGQIPMEFSRLTRLVKLDLSIYRDPGTQRPKIQNPNLFTLLHNLSGLTELYLDGVNISANGYEWGQAISSALPNLTVLSLSDCNLNGTFPDIIFERVQTLETLDLSYNTFLHGRLPESIGNLMELRKIEIFECNFSGPIPNSLANLSQLVYLDLSGNNFSGPIPSFQGSKKLTHIDLSYNSLTGVVLSTHFEGLLDLERIYLSYNSFIGSIPSSLFSLPSLQYIWLSGNKFSGPITGFSNESLSPLVSLDLSSNKLEGPIPAHFFHFLGLNSLSLSFNNFSGNIDLEIFQRFQNLSMLDLSYNNLTVNPSVTNSSLSSFPKLETLGLASCKLQKFPPLMNQSGLFYLDLSNNQISGVIPNWIWNISGGVPHALNLSCNLLVGFQPEFRLPPLYSLDLHSNQLQGEIPLPPESAQYLDYSRNNFSSIPAEIGKSIASAFFFYLSDNMLFGPIPPSVCNGSSLRFLDLSNNRFSGTIPQCLIDSGSRTLIILDLRNNNLTGSITGTFAEDCELRTLDLSGNNLEGEVPKSLANCADVEVLNLGTNNINGNFPCFLTNFSSLRVLALRSNKFHGNILCRGIDNNIWPKLQIIDLALNNFSGILPPAFFSQRKAIMDEGNAQTELNQLGFVKARGDYYQDSMIVFNKGIEMTLVKILTIFATIDFSNNNFKGEIPDIVGDLKSLCVLNLSHNALTGSIPRSLGNLKQLESLDLHSNQLQGEIPIPPKSAIYVDYSRNNFSSSMPAEIGSNIASAYFFSLSDNMLSGPIPPSICNGSRLEVLDLSNNGFSGTIPQCLIDSSSTTLGVLDLKNNNLTGNITGTLPEGCALRTLDLSENNLEGQVPKSLANCANAEFLNLGTNNINGYFPCFLMNLSNLRVLVLRSNKFHGNINCQGLCNNIWPNLQIIDLALNNFSGILPPQFFLQRKAMMDGGNAQTELNQLGFFVMAMGAYYQDSMTVINKGREMKLVKILTIFTAIDFSNNNFKGEIPDTVGHLKSLHALNLSHNALTGSIPSSLGNMTQLESLDFSWNKLSGNIPVTLASLTFLQVLNLSYNQLVGMIPRGSQLQTFSETSFEGNKGLCGAPLIASCREADPTRPRFDRRQEDEINWVYITATLGYTVGFGVIVGPLLYSKRWRQCYYKPIDRVILRILHHREQRARQQKRRNNINQLRRRQHH